MLDAAELTDMRAGIAATFDSTMTVSRAAGGTVVDALGGTTDGDATPSAAVPCHYRQPAAGREQLQADRMELVAPMVVIAAHDVDVQVGDTLTLDGTVTVQVEGLVDARTWHLSTQAMCERQGGAG